MEITKDMIIGELLEAKPEAAEILLSMGMHCLGCPSARGETIGQACEVHGVDVDEILDEINAL
jgi:hybrid cluster-associated redox disulfide protein